MKQNLLMKCIAEEKKLVPYIFTQKQVQIIKKYTSNQVLSNSEKKSLYTSIKKKLAGIQSISQEICIAGIEHIIPARLNLAKELLKQYPSSFIAGSYLFSQDYNDIDIFILSKKNYEVHKDTIHLIYITEKKLYEPLIQSAARISVANINPIREPKKIRLKLHEFMSLYHEAVIEFLQKDSKKENLRDLIFKSNYIRNILLNSHDLKDEVEKISLDKIDFIFAQVCSQYYSKSYLYNQLIDYLTDLKNSINAEKNNQHLLRYKQTYEGILHECRKSKTEA